MMKNVLLPRTHSLGMLPKRRSPWPVALTLWAGRLQGGGHRRFPLLSGLLLALLSLCGLAASAQCPYSTSTSYQLQGNLSPLTTAQNYYYDRAAQAFSNTPYWTFQAVGGATYTFSNCSGDLEDTHLYLQLVNSGTCVPVVYNDNNGPVCAGIKPSFQWTCPSSAQYSVTLAHNSGGSDSYLQTNQYLTYQVAYPTPVLTSLAPTSTAPGTTITLTGTGFLTATAVTFSGSSNNVVTANLTPNAAGTQLSVVVPGGAATGNVTVTTLGGTSNGLPLTVLSTMQLTARSPARHTNTAALASSIGLTFDLAVAPATAGNARVFSSLRGGQLVRGGNASTSGATLTIVPANPFRAGEVLQVSAPATVTSTAGLAARPQVYRFTAGVSPASGGIFTSVGSGLAIAAGGDVIVATTPADLDNDGTLDLVQVRSIGGGYNCYLEFLLNNGTGGFTRLATTAPLGTLLGFEVTAGDVDNDGDQDLVVSGQNGGSGPGMVLFRNAGNATFGAAIPILPGVTGATELGDMDGDGDLDILTTSAYAAAVYRNDGTGGFSSFYQLAGSFGISALADVDLDGDLDGVVVDLNRSLLVALNDGTGQLSFQPAITTLPYGDDPYALRIADVNGDGKLDALVLAENSTGGAAKIYACLGTGTGSFAAPSTFVTSNFSTKLMVGDVDGDGFLDVLTAGPVVSLHRNNGAGNFSAYSTLAVNVDNPKAIAIGDWDNDADLDFAVAGYGSSTPAVCLRFNQPAVPTLTGVAPNPAAYSALLTLTGTGLLNASAVKLNGVALTGYTVVSATSLTVTVPVGAVTGTLTVTTPGGTSNALPLTINNAPTALALSATSLLENTGPNAVVGILSTTDPDAGNTFTYSLVSGTGATDNALVNISGNQLRITTSPDYETRSSYAVRVRTTDQGGLFTEQAFIVSIIDVAPPTLAGISPGSALLGASVTLSGSNLFAATVVTFSGTSNNTVTTGISASGVNPNPTLTVAVPGGTTIGSGTVFVTTPEGSSGTVPFTANIPLVITGLTPARNALSVARTTTVGLTFNQALDGSTAGNVRVFSSQRGGQLVRGGNAMASGSTLTLSVAPAGGFKPGETVFVTVPTALTGSTGAAAVKQTYQFTAGVSSASPGVFGPAAVTPSVDLGTRPKRVAAGDVDNDGDLDFVTANGDNSTVSIRLNDGAGAYSGSAVVSVGSGSEAVVLDDIDGDGDLDLLTANSAASTVSVRTNTNGVFSGTTEVSVGTARDLVMADVDGDGDRDLLTANFASNTVSVRLNAGNGTFGGGGDYAAGNLPLALAAGDLDADGDVDVVVVNRDDNLVRILLNNGSGVFTNAAAYGVGSSPQGVALGDIDGDGDLDLLTANYTANTVSVGTNNGSGAFSGFPGVSVGSSPSYVALGDIDGDGDLDLLTANSTASSVSVRLNSGSGSFSGTTSIAVGATPLGLALGDVDADGDLDLLVAALNSNAVNVQLNKLPAPALISLSPTSGPVGTSVTLTGTNFVNGGSTVKFNGTTATSVTFTSATSLTAVVPTGASTGNVTVTTPDGTSAGVAFTVLFQIVSRTPARNAIAAPRSTNVGLTFSDAVSAATAGNVRVFSRQRGGQLVRGGNATASGSTLTVAPANAFKPGETVFVTVPTALTGSAGTAATRQVFQFTAGVSSASPGVFGPAAVTPSVDLGTRPKRVAAGDVDNDGDLDFVTANGDNSTVSIRLNDGAGAYSGSAVVSVGSGSEAVVLDDIDGDGDLDLLTANSAASTVSVRTNTNGVFSGTTEVSVGTARDLVMADVDGDGDRDLLTANFASNTVSVRLNAGNGTFGGGGDYAAGNLPLALAAGDLDADGDVDVVVVNRDDNLVRILLNNGSGVFTNAAAYGVGSSPQGVALGDIDGDGDLDLLTANYTANTVSVGTNNGSGAFSGFPGVSVGSSPSYVALGDIDGDGDLDLLTANSTASSVSVRLNSGSGSFSGTTSIAVGATPLGLALGDVDADGDLDLLVAALNSNAVNVQLNKLPAPALISLSPTSGPVGTSVTLTGTNFVNGGSTVKFNGTTATSVTFTSATSLTAVVPTGASTGNVTVTTPDGTSAGVSFTVTIAPDLTISTGTAASPTLIAAGIYNNITVTGSGYAQPGGAVITNGAFLVLNGGGLDTNCQALTGPGSFTLAAGATLGICDAAGISSSGATGAVQVSGGRSFSADALYTYNGTVAQATGSGLPATVRTLTLGNAAGLALASALTATTSVALPTGVLALGANVLTLAPAATLSETATGYATGTVQTTRSLATAGVTESFGGLGLTLTPGGSTLPGSTLVRRVTGTALPGAGTSQSVRRYFDIQPTTRTGLNVALVLTARDSERNGIAPANLRLFKSDNNGSTWQLQGAATYATATTGGLTTYSASLGSVSNFSIWTLGNAANPLPVELGAFTAERRDEAAYLRWATASEKNSAYFEAEVSPDGTAFRSVGRVAAQGSTTQRHDYTLTDPRLLAYGAPLVYYRLRQVDLDGTASYSPVRVLAVGGGPAAFRAVAWPNPAQNGMATRLQVSGPDAGLPVELTLTDAAGRVLAQRTVAADAGALALPEADNRPAGVYLLRVRQGAAQQVLRLLRE